ncbi:MAG: FkbM family methyltransferase [Aquihabitans sp.]
MPSLKRTARQVRKRAALIRQTGQLRPDHIALAASGHTIYIDRDDRRGLEIVRGGGRGHQPALIALWRKAVEVLEPALVIDVGTNYGELVLNTRYPAGCRVVAIEANPRITPLLQRSLSAHPDAARMELHAVLASDTDQGSQHLHIDPDWSGSAGTSLDRTTDGAALIDVVVPVRTLAALLAEQETATAAPLLLTVDTEVSEAEVLGGMPGLLAEASSVVALVEFEPTHLARQGTDPAALFSTLQGIGRCWSVDWDGRTAPIDSAPTDSGDVLVVSDAAVARALGLDDA